MADQSARNDDNQNPALIAHTGTAGTSETVRVVASSDGALRVDLVAGDTINIGTMTVSTVDLLKAGTITKVEGGSIAMTAGTITDLLKAEDTQHTTGDKGVMLLGINVIDPGSGVSGTNDGDYTPVNIFNGAMTIAGDKLHAYADDHNYSPIKIGGYASATAPSDVTTGDRVDAWFLLNGAQAAQVVGGTITNVGTNVGVGTVTGLGTCTTVTTVSNITNGSIRVTVGTIAAGSVRMTVGTVNAGTINVGTITAGTINTGTVNAGTIDLLKAGTITRVEQGSITMTTGTIATGSIVVTAGTVETTLGDIQGGTIDMLTDGTVQIKGGTVTTTMGDLTGGTIDLLTDGTVQVKGGTIAEITNGSIVVTAGTVTTSMGDLSGGTIDQITTGSIVVTAGTVETTMGDLSGGTIDLLTAGTITRLEQGSINITAGTIGTLAAVGQVHNAGTIQTIVAGTVTNVGTVVGVGSVGNIAKVHNAGSVEVVKAGTITRVEQGSITMTVGTIAAGTMNVNVNPVPGVVLTTPTAIGSAGTAMPLPASALSGRKSVLCYNSGTVTVYIGGGTVTTAAGIPVGTGAYSPSLDLGTGILYGIVAADTVGGTLIVMEVS